MSIDRTIHSLPEHYPAISAESDRLGFSMKSDLQAGSLLRTLAASKPSATLLELGTGTGLSAAWLLDGMDAKSQLHSVDNDAQVMSVARKFLGHDDRLVLHQGDGGEYLQSCAPQSYDLIFADAWPGKFSHLNEALAALKVGGVYVVDDLLPQPNWPEGHARKIPVFIEELESQSQLSITKLGWSTGILIAVKMA